MVNVQMRLILFWILLRFVSSEFEWLDPVMHVPTTPNSLVPDNTVILVELNEYALPLCLYRQEILLQRGLQELFNRSIYVVLESQILSECQNKLGNCVTFPSANFSGRGDSGTSLYQSIIWMKHLPVLHLLERGVNVLFMDTDILLFQNPFDHFTAADFMWNQGSQPYWVNSGLLFVRPTPHTKAMFSDVLRANRSEYKLDQDWFTKNMIKYKSTGARAGGLAPLPMQFCNRCVVGTCKKLGCTVTSYHANCQSGLRAKMRTLKDFANHMDENCPNEKLEKREKFKNNKLIN